MEAFVHFVRTVSPLAAGLLVGSIWQSVLLTLLVAAGLRLLRSVPAATRTVAWATVLVLIVLLPALAVLLTGHTQAAPHAEVHLAQDWSVAVLAIWATLSAWRAGQLLMNAGRLWLLARAATPVNLEGMAGTSLRQGLRPALLCVSPGVTQPSLAGFFRPRILLPEGLLEQLSPAELQHVILHEMEHLRRGDDWLNLLQQLSLVLMPLNPTLLWIDRRLCRDREIACDDGVVKATRAHRAYAACLVKLAEDSLLRKSVTLALSALGTRARESEFAGRVRRILAGPQPMLRQGRNHLGLATLALSALAGTALLVRSPEWISFDGGTTETAQAVQPLAASPLTSALPVAAMQGRQAAPMLTRAVLDGSAPIAVSAALKSSGVRRTASPARTFEPVRIRQQRAKQSHWRTATVRADEAMLSSLHRTSAETDPPTPRMVVTEFVVAQPALISQWAAVPTQDGWLIVQL